MKSSASFCMMQQRRVTRRLCAAVLLVAAGCGSPHVASTPTPAASASATPIRYLVRMPDPTTPLALVEARSPPRGKPAVDLMMAVWSPGYYVREDYATRIRDLSASTADGRPLT